MSEFQLDAALANDTQSLGRLQLSHVLLMNESQFPWVILVPERSNLVEVHELTTSDQITLSAEFTSVSKLLKEFYVADKINLGALGNVVPQLHIHIIARYKHDRAWPQPVWGNYQARPYADPDLLAQRNALRELFSNHLNNFQSCYTCLATFT